MSNHKINIEADSVAEKLAAILEAVEKDCTDETHRTETGAHGRSRVIKNGIHNAREYLTSEFIELLEEAKDALSDYRRSVEEHGPEPRKCWIALTVDTNECDPEYMAVASLFSTREKARKCIDGAISEDTSEGGCWEPDDVKWSDSGDICEYGGGQIVHRVAEMTIQD